MSHQGSPEAVDFFWGPVGSGSWTALWNTTVLPAPDLERRASERVQSAGWPGEAHETRVPPSESFPIHPECDPEMRTSDPVQASGLAMPSSHWTVPNAKPGFTQSAAWPGGAQYPRSESFSLHPDLVAMAGEPASSQLQHNGRPTRPTNPAPVLWTTGISKKRHHEVNGASARKRCKLTEGAKPGLHQSGGRPGETYEPRAVSSCPRPEIDPASNPVQAGSLVVPPSDSTAAIAEPGHNQPADWPQEAPGTQEPRCESFALHPECVAPVAMAGEPTIKVVRPTPPFPRLLGKRTTRALEDIATDYSS
jgi:hypothetical protein